MWVVGRGSWVVGRGSWVVGVGRGSWVVGRGSWVWVNVVGKKLSSKKRKIKKLKGKSCKIHVTKISEYKPVLFPLPAVSKTNKRIL